MTGNENSYKAKRVEKAARYETIYQHPLFNGKSLQTCVRCQQSHLKCTFEFPGPCSVCKKRKIEDTCKYVFRDRSLRRRRRRGEKRTWQINYPQFQGPRAIEQLPQSSNVQSRGPQASNQYVEAYMSTARASRHHGGSNSRTPHSASSTKREYAETSGRDDVSGTARSSKRRKNTKGQGTRKQIKPLFESDVESQYTATIDPEIELTD
ncbi:MAG: hypothetical protein LQ349_000323 [Xanthoria aureola]|nr:MAG: hypothetical protein LQ349_000323 [Xanthoria aureola]